MNPPTILLHLALAGLAQASSVAPLPNRLGDTGLYADSGSLTLAADVLPYSPQYPLWTDGASKERYLYLPPGTAIDGSDPERFVFPVGTKLWKEFAWERRVETRMIERLDDGSWRYATYRWNPEGTDATLVGPRGARAVYEVAPGLSHDLPSRADCTLCHEGGPNRVLGVTALQLSPLRDPLAPHAEPLAPGDIDLAALVERGLLVNFPAALLRVPPMINATTPIGRAAVGYLQANCGHCHNPAGPLATLGLDLAYPLAAAHGYPAPAVASTLERASHFRTERADERLLGANPDRSILLTRVSSRNPVDQMPPLGTHAVDPDGVDLLTAWVQEELARLEPARFTLAAREQR